MGVVNEELECTYKDGLDGPVRFEEIEEGEALQERLSSDSEDGDNDEDVIIKYVASMRFQTCSKLTCFQNRYCDRSSHLVQ